MNGVRRSAYADRLLEFPGLVFSDGAEFSQRGKWRERFRTRIGPSFDGRIIFDIGCADASLLSAVSAKHPQTAFIGLDWKCRGLCTAAERLIRDGAENVVLLHGRAQHIGRIFAEEELDQIWLFHPEPCDKPKELPNRLFAEPFLVEASRVLRTGGSFILKTDHAGYYQWALALFDVSEPSVFAEVRARRTKPQTLRIRTSELIDPQQLPRASATLTDLFEVALHSHHYWADPAAQAATAACVFANVTTAFEQKFKQKRWPIYYLELEKRMR